MTSQILLPGVLISLVLLSMYPTIAVCRSVHDATIALKTLKVEDATSHDIIDQVFYVELQANYLHRSSKKVLKSVIDSTMSSTWVLPTAAQETHLATSDLFECASGDGCKQSTVCVFDSQNLLGGRLPTVQALANVPQPRCQAILADVELALGGIQIEKAPVVFPQKLQANDVEWQVLTAGVRAGLGLGSINPNVDTSDAHEKPKSFFNQLAKDFQVGVRGFSLSVHPSAKSVLMIGPANGYYYQGALTSYNNRNSREHDDQTWQLKIDQITVAKHFVVELPTVDNTYDAKPHVILDTSTQFFWGPQEQVAELVNQMNQISHLQCAKQAPQTYYECAEHDLKKFPSLSVKFVGEERVFELKPEQYAEPQTVGGVQKSLLLFRENIFGSTFGLLGSGVKRWTFGTSFMRDVYTHFDLEQNKVSLAEANHTEPGNLYIKKTWRYVALAVGAALLLGGIAVILSQFEAVKVPEIPEIPVASKPQAQVEKKTPQKNQKRSPSPVSRNVSPPTVIIPNFNYSGYQGQGYNPNFVQFPGQRSMISPHSNTQNTHHY